MSEALSLWWQDMLLFEKINWMIAIPATALFLLQTILTFVGGDVDDIDGDIDSSIDGDTGIDFQFLTLKNFVAFFTIYGWTGIVCVDAGLSNTLSTFISLFAGLIMMAIMSTLIYLMGKMTDDGTLRLSNAIGKTASVYLRIPAKRGGLGKVQVKVQGIQTLDAMTDSEEEIPTGGLVEVIEIINNELLLVKPYNL